MSLFSASFFSSVIWVTSDFLPPFLQRKQGGPTTEQDKEKTSGFFPLSCCGHNHKTAKGWRGVSRGM